MPDVRGGLLKRQPSALMKFLQPYLDQMSVPSTVRPRGPVAQDDMLGAVGRAALLPTRAMMAMPPETPASLGMLGRIHEAIDPVRGFGGYGNVAAMALPPGAAGRGGLLEHDLGQFPTTTPGRIMRTTKREGGYTVNLVTGDVPQTGILAGKYPNEDPRTRVLLGPLTRKQIEAHATQNKEVLGLPEHHFGTWEDKDTGKTYLDVSVRFPPDQIRQATKFAEKTQQKSMAQLAPGKPVEFPPVGDYPGFVSGTWTPEGVVPFDQRVREMSARGREYMAQHPGADWWATPNIQRVYGAQRAPQMRGLLSATSTNTEPPANVVQASEYMRRAIKGEPMIQPDFRVPATALSGFRMPKPGSAMSLEENRAHNLLAASRGETDPAAYHGPVVQEKVGALSGNPATIVMDRILTRLTEQPSHGIYAMPKAGQSPVGANRQKALDVITEEAINAGETPNRFSANLWAGTREYVKQHGELYGTDLRGTQKATRGSESKSYDDLFMDRVRAKAAHLRISVMEMEKRLRNGDAELLSYLLASFAAPALAGRVRRDQGSVKPLPDNVSP